MKHRNSSIVLALAIASLALQGCSSDAGASPACSECALLDARVAALEAKTAAAEARLAEAEARLPEIRGVAFADALVVTPAAGAATRKADLGADVPVDAVIGTLVGYAAPNGDAATATATLGSSTSGYLFSVPAGQGPSETVAVAGPVYFEGAGCTGQAWVAGTGSGAVVSLLGARTGLVFRVLAGTFGEVVDRPEQYWTVPKGSTPVAGAWASKMVNVDECLADAGASPIMFPAAPNDPAVTGLPSGPLGGKVGLGAGL